MSADAVRAEDRSLRGSPAIDVHGGLPRAFDMAVGHDPERTAIVAPTRTSTMAGLAQDEQSLARLLERAGHRTVLVTPSDPVMLAVAVLAAARVGARAVLADPARPAPVLRGLAEQVGATAVVSDVGPAGEPSLHDTGVRASRTRPEPREDDRSMHREAQDAPVWIPTSGTTGDPALVGLSARALLGMAVEAAALGIVVPGDRVARLATHLGIGPLLSALVLGLPYVGLDVRRITPSGFLPLLARHDVTYLHLAPTLLRALLPRDSARALTRRRTTGRSPIRLVGSGGEPLRWEDVDRIGVTFGQDVMVLHTYSSTEAGMVTLRSLRAGESPGRPSARVDAGPEGRQTDGIGSTLTAGRPLPGRDVWIDAGDGLPAADGVEGEIIVDGRFGTVGQRVGRTPDGRQRVRTGDRGILAPDGTLTVTGRLGRDGKVGLWRVDLRALETAIASIEGVIDVAVRPDGPDDASEAGAASAPRSLVAHLLVDGRSSVSDEAVHAAIGALTSAAVPRRIVRHTGVMPTLSSGKLDAAELARVVSERS